MSVDATGKKLLRLLQPEQPAALRRSALVVLGAVGSKDRELADAVCAILGDPDPELRLEAMQLVGKLRIDRALPQLLERVAAGGPEADLAAQAAAHLGPKGISGLQELMGKTAPGLRRRIAGALATGGTPGAETAAIDTLLDSDLGVVDAATRTLISQVRTLGETERHDLAEHILELLKPKKKMKLPAPSEAALLRVLAALGDPRAEGSFWARTEADHPAALRAEALQALGSLPPPSGAVALRRLIACASDADFRVVAPALMLLKNLGAAGKNTKDWLTLLQAPDVAARRFALERVAGQDGPEVAAALLAQLKHPDRGLQEQALAALAQLEHGRKALADQLLQAESPDEAWRLARAQASFVPDYSSALKAKGLQQACAFLEADDRRADAFLFLLRQAGPKELRDRLAERALALRKKKQYATALHYLRLLAHDPACGEELRFELAACGLKLSAQDLAPTARAADPCLQHFARLIHSHDTPPQYLEQAKWLEPEDLFYLGFHFSEGKGPEREFGAGALKLLLKKSPRSKLARDARAKLKSFGLG